MTFLLFFVPTTLTIFSFKARCKLLWRRSHKERVLIANVEVSAAVKLKNVENGK
jgi:hypothetical protein